MTNESVLTDQQLRQYRDKLTREIQFLDEEKEQFDYDYAPETCQFYEGQIVGLKLARTYFDRMLEEYREATASKEIVFVEAKGE